MRFIRDKKNILINIVLCLFVFMLAICGAEFALRKIDIEGFSGYKIFLGERRNYKDYTLLAQVVASANKDFEFTSGNCYPSNPTGLLPLKVINPYDGKYWYCVSYNKKQRRQGYNPERKRQIALVGDSFTFGEGVKETDTLGYLLNEKYPKINFQNWGIMGADTGSVMQTCKKIIEFAPAVDEVIYFYNLDDVAMSRMAISQREYILFQKKMIYWPKDEEHSLVKVLSKSALFSLARKVWQMKKVSFLTTQLYKDMYLSENNRQGFLMTMDDIRSIKIMLAEHGISFRLVIYPLLYKDLLGRYPAESIHAEIINACNKRGIICLDGYEPFKSYYSLKRFAVHPLDYHPNGLSNREIVDYIHKKDFVIDRPE